MQHAPETKEERHEIVVRGRAIYDASIRARLAPEHIGEFASIDVDSGDFEVAKRSLDASLRLRERRPDGILFLIRIGYNAAYSMGGQLRRVSA